MNRLRCPSCGMPTIADALEDVADDELLCNRCNEKDEIENDIGILRFEISRIDKEIKALKISARKFAAPSTTAHWIELQRTNEILKMRLGAALKPGKENDDG